MLMLLLNLPCGMQRTLQMAYMTCFQAKSSGKTATFSSMVVVTFFDPGITRIGNLIQPLVSMMKWKTLPSGRRRTPHTTSSNRSTAAPTRRSCDGDFAHARSPHPNELFTILSLLRGKGSTNCVVSCHSPSPGEHSCTLIDAPPLKLCVDISAPPCLAVS
ncbi:hypothetical protein BD309DRAFT_969750 [Dichomitus squalens]|uniref:Uncharacterized protein n=1 Tax=Dichomitus squalens TaxID=114155 RepID=A0A4Q9NI91_9APHY|nr:hypothetical protein BD309DRAFT_969750 [Dichomitus squalens]TBU51666.1 hypothetical protein BD310DRAFT_941823 [Dichomitus squalens]